MRLITRWTGPLAACTLLVGLACSGDSTDPVQPVLVVAIGGDGQNAAANSALPLPLTVEVFGSDSQPFAGATVIWTVTTGVAAAAPTSSITDSLGLAATALTLGAAAGPITVTATVAGLAPATFGATVLTVCTTGVAYTFGTTVNGSLATTDCSIGQFYTDLYAVTLPGPTSATISEHAPTFDTFLELYAPPLKVLAGNDDSAGVTLNSRIKAFLAPGDYLIAPSSYTPLDTGAYTLTTDTVPQTLDGCEEIWATRGVTFADSVRASDCLDAGGPYYSDRVALILDSGTVLTAHEVSADFDSYLILFNPLTGYFDFNDDSVSGVVLNSYLVTTIPQTAVYVLDIGTFDTATVGAYSFEIRSSLTLAGRRAPQRLAPATFRLPRGVKLPRAPLPWAGTDRRRVKPRR